MSEICEDTETERRTCHSLARSTAQSQKPNDISVNHTDDSFVIHVQENDVGRHIRCPHEWSGPNCNIPVVGTDTSRQLSLVRP